MSISAEIIKTHKSIINYLKFYFRKWWNLLISSLRDDSKFWVENLKMISNFLENLQYKERHTPQRSRTNSIGPFLTKEILEFSLSIVGNLKEEDYEFAMDCIIHKYNKEVHIIFNEIKAIIGSITKEVSTSLDIKKSKENELIIEENKQQIDWYSLLSNLENRKIWF